LGLLSHLGGVREKRLERDERFGNSKPANARDLPSQSSESAFYRRGKRVHVTVREDGKL